jgi:hypothetical protein
MDQARGMHGIVEKCVSNFIHKFRREEIAWETQI